MKITVTREDIDKGYREDCMNCPIAEAMKRTYPGLMPMVEVPSVSLFSANLIDATVWVGTLPEEASVFASRFDCHYSVAPFEFDLPFEGTAEGTAK